jgi:hypothetical protein
VILVFSACLFEKTYVVWYLSENRAHEDFDR